MTTRRRVPRGFTLIELMMVVAIIGVIASVAIPTFTKVSLRARSAERRVVMRIIKQSVEDTYVRAGRLELGGVATNFVFANPNPPLPPTTYKRNFVPATPGWALLTTAGAVEGQLYYQYQFWVIDFPGAQWFFEQASGDLDGDGVLSTKQIWWQRENGVYVTHPDWGWVMPLDGAEDDAGPSRTF